MTKNWYFGLDIGTNSVGWAATDPSYNVLNINNKRLIGVELFEEAKTAEERRLFRSQRRRLDRRNWRLQLLRDEFEKEIAKVDTEFLLRLQESKYHAEDKKVNTKHALFADEFYTDKHFNKQYPTTYHLRESMKSEVKPDIRKVYLALHHIMKSRGHHLFVGQSFTNGTVEVALQELLNTLNLTVDLNKAIEICLRKDNTTNKAKAFKELTDDKRLQEIFRLIFGGNVALEKIYDLPEYKELDSSVKSISFKNKIYDDVRPEYESAIGDNIELLDKIKLVYDAIILSEIKKDGLSLSASKVETYNKHKNDIKRLKKLIMSESTLSRKERKELYHHIMLKDEKKLNNYVHYTRRSSHDKSCDYESFKKFLKGELEKLTTSKEQETIITELDLGTFLPMLRTNDNGVIPYQIHKEELIAILNNAKQYHEFLTEEVIDRLVKIFEFKIPYFVGPLNNHGEFAWSVRKPGQEKTPVTPWNYHEVIDETKTAELFITNLTNNCSYLENEKVIPKESLLYSEYMVLNELNAIRFDGERITPEIRDIIIDELFLSQKTTVTKNKIKKLLVSKKLINKDAEITGIDNIVKSNMKGRFEFTSLLGDKFNTEHVENMIYWLTVYGDAKHLVHDNIESHYPGVYTEDEINNILKLKFKDWSAFSREFLTEIHSKMFVDTETGECLNIIDTLRNSNLILMEILSNKYDFMTQIDEINAKQSKAIEEITPKILDNLYVSPSIKRAIWQTIKINERLKKEIGSEPAKVFIETTRTNQAPKVENDSRYLTLLKLYSKIKDVKGLDINVKALHASLKAETPSNLKSKKLYLYYAQLGKCLYTGKNIDKEQINSILEYDIDHIYPQSKTKDDSMNNTVLVYRTANAEKSDTYPLSASIQETNKVLWTVLKDAKLISDEKYNRLVRTTGFTKDELTGFIARQLVETSQSIKVIGRLLAKINPNSRICYSKAENVNAFKQNYGKIKECNRKSQNKEQIIKVRELNDLHHAYDAYLNIVVGNVYDMKFTANPRNFIESSEDNRKYSLNTLFYYTVKDAWIVDHTIKTVDRELNNTHVYVNKRAAQKTGKLFDATIYKANKAKPGVYYPIKTKDGRMLDVTKYGGYSSVAIAYYTLVSYKLTSPKEEVENTYLVPVPIYKVNRIKTQDDLVEHAYVTIPHKDNEELSDIKILREKLYTYSRVTLGGLPVYLGGKTGNYITYRSALQITFDYDTTRRLKTIFSYINWQKANRNKGDIWKSITAEDNMLVYDAIIAKMQEEIVNKINKNKFDELQDAKYKEKFAKLGLNEQCLVLAELLNLITTRLVPNAAVLKLIDFSASVNLTGLKGFAA